MNIRNTQVNLWSESNLVHTINVRSDWDIKDFDQVKKMFPDCTIKTSRKIYPISFLDVLCWLNIRY